MTSATEFTTWNLVVRDTGTDRGRGVFAAQAFRRNEVVEVCPVYIVREHFSQLPLDLKRLVFAWGWLGGEPNTSAIALGFGSIYNHADPASLRYEADVSSSALRFITVRDVREGEELTVNYTAIGGHSEGNENRWFERMGVRKL